MEKISGLNEFRLFNHNTNIEFEIFKEDKAETFGDWLTRIKLKVSQSQNMNSQKEKGVFSQMSKNLKKGDIIGTLKKWVQKIISN